jgi:HTH-type transcriptional regulator / antitoxin HigA
MNIFPIHTKADHRKALNRASELMMMDPAPGSPASDELEVLAQLIEGYERKHYDIGSPTPTELITFVMEQQGLTKRDMVSYLGSPSRVSEVLSGKRSLTLQMIRNLHLGMGLPLEALVMGSIKLSDNKQAKTQAAVTRPTRKAVKTMPQPPKRRVKAKAI